MLVLAELALPGYNIWVQRIHKRRLKTTRSKMVMGLGSSIALVVVLAISASGAALFRDNQSHNTAIAGTSMSTQADPKPLAKLPATSSETPSTNSSPDQTDPTNLTLPGETSDSVKAALPIAKNNDGAHGCAINMISTVADYNHDVDKQKSKLDSTLSFKVGLNISGQYVTDYNAKVIALFNQYQSEAKENNCTWPIKEPALLKTTYPL